MTSPTSAREALLAEALGDVARLFDRLESLAAQLDATRQSLSEANSKLAEHLGAIDVALSSAALSPKPASSEQVLRQTLPLVQKLVNAQASTLRSMLQKTLDEHVDGWLARLDGHLLRSLSRRIERPWDGWLTHVASAGCSAALTWWIVTSTVPR